MKPNTSTVIMIILLIIAISIAIFKLVYVWSNPDIPDWVRFLILTR